MSIIRKTATNDEGAQVRPAAGAVTTKKPARAFSMKHVATTTTVTTTRVQTAASALRWLGILLAALVLVQLGVWLGCKGASTKCCSASTHRRPPLPLLHKIATTDRRRPTNASTSTAAALKHRRLVQNACRHAIVPLNPSCPRQLVVKYLESAGFGHQFTEMLFGMYAARYLGLTFTWSAIASSGDHGDDYTGLVERLGFEEMFVDGLGLAKADDLRELWRRRDTSQPNPLLFGEWIEAGNMDKRGIALLSCNNSVLAIEGWWHCRGVADNNCFWAPEHEFLFQRFGGCLRAGVGAYGKVFSSGKRCLLLENIDKTSASPHHLSRDTVVVVWHLRFGDVALVHKPGDAFFANVIEALREITGFSQGLVKRVRIVLVGGGKGTAGVPGFYEDSLRGVIMGADGAAAYTDDLVEFQVERLNASSFEDQFVAMMQADILVGSGSSVPQVAALLSPGRPLFFNHVPKHGYGYGQEATAEVVDMDEQGRVLDSLRRVRLMLFERMDGGSVGNDDDDDEGWACRWRRRQRQPGAGGQREHHI